jgi:hypothetical protein
MLSLSVCHASATMAMDPLTIPAHSLMINKREIYNIETHPSVSGVCDWGFSMMIFFAIQGPFALFYSRISILSQ